MKMKPQKEKSLGQIAHDAGAQAGGWARKWDDMQGSQKEEWEILAKAVAQEVLLRIGATTDKKG
jgi:hypothetical protein